MKKLLFSLLVLFITTSAVTVSAQVLEEGYIKMEITEATSDDPQVAMGLEMMKGSQTEIFFKGGKNLSKMNMMGGMVDMSTLYDTEGGSVDMLFNMMGQKMHIESTTEEMEAANKEQAEAAKDIKVEFDESDVKEILGYKCVKASIKSPDMAAGMSMTLYVARDIQASSKMLQGLQNYDLGGFPLEFTMSNAQMKMTFSAIDLKKEVDAGVFALETGGYEKLTFKEFQERMAAFGGGGGFGF